MSISQKLEEWWDAEECTDDIHEIIQEIKALEQSHSKATNSQLWQEYCSLQDQLNEANEEIKRLKAI
ncbi:MAG: hypothetical protein K2X27_06700 [Candidatus Obscuribacterales bacterium]|nr:hypothetical protein [Candidatus Obscuribacterales bacterium]